MKLKGRVVYNYKPKKEGVLGFIAFERELWRNEDDYNITVQIQAVRMDGSECMEVLGETKPFNLGIYNHTFRLHCCGVTFAYSQNEDHLYIDQTEISV